MLVLNLHSTRGATGSCSSCGSCFAWIIFFWFQRLVGHRDLCHGGLREEAPELQLLFLLLFQQLAAHQPDDRGVVNKDVYHVGAVFDFLVETNKQLLPISLLPGLGRKDGGIVLLLVS